MTPRSARRRLASPSTVVAALALVAAPLSAQERGLVLTGTVVDGGSMQPIPGAFVAQGDNKQGVLSDSLGTFQLSVVPGAPGYVLRVAQLGYETQAFPVRADQAMSPLVLALKPDPVKIQGLQVIVDGLASRRRGAQYGIVDLYTMKDLVQRSDPSAYEMVRRILPMASPCTPDADSLCVTNRGQQESVVACVDDHRVLGEWQELASIDPRGLFMVEAYRRAGEVRFYTRGYIARLAEQGRELPPLSFGCTGAPRDGGPGLSP